MKTKSIQKKAPTPEIPFPKLMIREFYPANPKLVGEIYLVMEKNGKVYRGTIVHSKIPQRVGRFDNWSDTGMVDYFGKVELSN